MTWSPQNYISSELTHFVGGKLKDTDAQYHLLIDIIKSGWLTHPPHNPNISGNLTVNTSAKISQNEMYAPEIICFCDIPRENLGIHIDKYSRFGLSFDKEFIIQHGGAPVHYLPKEAKVKILKNLAYFTKKEWDNCSALNGNQREEYIYDSIGKGEHFDDMVEEYHKLFELLRNLIMENRKTPGIPDDHRRLMDLQRFFDFHIFSYLKFFDHHLDDEHSDNYYFEREWRIVGNLQFSVENIKTIFIPKDYDKQFLTDCPQYSGRKEVL